MNIYTEINNLEVNESIKTNTYFVMAHLSEYYHLIKENDIYDTQMGTVIIDFTPEFWGSQLSLEIGKNGMTYFAERNYKLQSMSERLDITSESLRILKEDLRKTKLKIK